MSLAPEEWRPIAGWPYEVSSLGRVRRSEDGGSPIAKKGRLLKPKTDKNGYHVVVLCNGPGVTLDRKIHTLVCEAFNGAKPAGAQVRHLDGISSHNFPHNLVWGTALENAADRVVHGTQKTGEHSHRAVLTQSQVNDIRKRYEADRNREGRQRVQRGWIQKEAARLGLSVHTIHTVVKKGYGL